jgi:effector-binding domain-containing protein
MDYQVVEKHVAAVPLAVVRRKARLSELSKVVPACCGEVWNFVRAHQIPQPGRHVAVYLDGEINLEVGVEVPGPFVGDGNVVPSSTPAGLVAWVVHMGPYSRLGDAYDAIKSWCASRGQKTAGPSWEVYGHGTDDPAKTRTDIYCMLEPAPKWDA